MDLRNKKILITGGAGFLGSHVVEKLIARGVPVTNILVPRSKDYDLRRWENCLTVTRGVDVVIHLAAFVGGIKLNQQNPGKMFYDNAIMSTQLMEAARQLDIQKFIAVGTVCGYPKIPPSIPFKEDDLWMGYPEETNAPYGLAKRMHLVQAQAYRQQYGMNAIYLILVNLYGPRDKFDPDASHVIPALVRKVYEAKIKNSPYIDAWGTGEATREFIYVEDAAEAIVTAAERYNKPEPVNIGTGREISIKRLLETICRLIDYRGEIRWDASKPNGQPRRLFDVSRAEREFGFKSKTDFEEGLRKTIDWYIKNPNA
ncbi:MAG: GDP-L-fucose synthase [Patescibacteria group bacterium]